jgi:hypothetical protein
MKRARAGGEQAARGEARARGLELGEHLPIVGNASCG